MMDMNNAPQNYRAYAGIGSRKISSAEAQTIRNLAKRLAEAGYWLHSGNALGADQAFEQGARYQAIAFMPWPKYNDDICRDALRCTQLNAAAREKAIALHPRGQYFDAPTLKLMTRNVQIIEGFAGIPRVDFIVACADPRLGGGVSSGSAMAYEVARRSGIPFVNLRAPGWERKFDDLMGAPSQAATRDAVRAALAMPGSKSILP